MPSVPPPMYGSVCIHSTASTEKRVDDLASSDLKTANLEASRSTDQTLQTHQAMAHQGQKMVAGVSQTVASAAAVVPPMHGGISLLRTGTTDAVRTAVAALQDKKNSWHVARSFAEVPLTAEGVTMLQNDPRINRELGAVLGWSAGGIVGGALSTKCASILDSYLVPSFSSVAIIIGIGIGTAISVAALGGIVGATVGLPKGVLPKNIRLRGLFYTGIVDSKKLSAAITSLIGRNANIDRAAGEVTELLNGAVLGGKLSLTAEQIAGVEIYYDLARSALRVESV